MLRFTSPLWLALLTATFAWAADAAPVRVMSFNLRYATAPDGINAWNLRKDFLAETITTFDPDLLGTQETLAVQRDFLNARLEGYEVLAAGRDDGKDKGEMAALYFRKARFEKIEGGHFWLSETPETVGSKGWDAALPRIATWVKLKDLAEPTALPVFFLNTHFDHRGNRARTESARLIRSRIGELGKDCRIIITGDFNAGEGSGPYTALFGEDSGQASPVRDTFRDRYPMRGKEEGTFGNFRASATGGDRIDWIACSRDWEVRLAGIDRTEREGRTPSDHFPVTAVLRPADPANQNRLRVLTYNIHHGEGTDGRLDLLRQAKIIRAADADLVALQEVDDRTRRSNGVDQAAELARLTGLSGAFGKAIDFQGGGYGQAILSRELLGETQVHLLPNLAKREQRIAFEARLRAKGRELLFVTTHLDHQEEKLREDQARKLSLLYAASEVPVVLAGDLNAEPESKSLAILNARWAGGEADPKLASFPADNPRTQIDYILHQPREAFPVIGKTVLEEKVASDHRPVLAVLEWVPGKK